MRLKIRDSHLTCKVANKCLNVREPVEVVEWNKWWSPFLPLPSCESSVSVKENPDRKKKDFVKFASMTINGTYYRSSWYIFLVYFRYYVEVRCFLFLVFKLSVMFFAKTCWRWNVSIVSLTIFICSCVRSWLILL